MAYKTEILTKTTVNAVLLSALMSVLMFPTMAGGVRFLDMGFLSWLHLVPLLVAIHPYNFKTKFAFCLAYGFLATAGQLFWLVSAVHYFGGLSIPISILIFCLLALFLATISAMFLAAASWVNHLNRIPLGILLPLFLLARDVCLYLPFGGFPWALPGYSQGHWIRYFQWIDHTGILGLDFYIYLFNALIAEALIFVFYRRQLDNMVSRFLMAFFTMLISFSLSFLASQAYEKNKTSPGGLTLALIQGNISQDSKWDPYKSQENLQRYLRLTNLAVQNGAELVIWPETAYPYGLNETSLSRERFLEQDGLPAPIFFGAVTAKREGGLPILHNSVIHADRFSNLVAVYSKRHLVPFGEYVPFKEYLPFVQKITQGVGDFRPGEAPVLFKAGGFSFGSLICFEDVFGEMARSAVAAGAQVLVNYTNDAWYGKSSAAYQHLVFSQFRALETRRPLVRSTNTGVTAIISPVGEVVTELPIFKEKYMLHTLKIDLADSYYVRHGDTWAWYAAGAAFLIFFYTLGKWRFGPVKKEF